MAARFLVRPRVAVNTGNYTAGFTVSFVSEFILGIRGRPMATISGRVRGEFREFSAGCREIIRNFFREGNVHVYARE